MRGSGQQPGLDPASVQPAPPPPPQLPLPVPQSLWADSRGHRPLLRRGITEEGTSPCHLTRCSGEQGSGEEGKRSLHLEEQPNPLRKPLFAKTQPRRRLARATSASFPKDSAIPTTWSGAAGREPLRKRRWQRFLATATPASSLFLAHQQAGSCLHVPLGSSLESRKIFFSLLAHTREGHRKDMGAVQPLAPMAGLLRGALSLPKCARAQRQRTHPCAWRLPRWPTDPSSPCW